MLKNRIQLEPTEHDVVNSLHYAFAETLAHRRHPRARVLLAKPLSDNDAVNLGWPG